MSKAKKYKYEKGDKVGLYEIIKPLPSEPNVKNLVIYCECLLCGEKVKRWANRLGSKHRGCDANVKIEKQKPEPETMHPLLHTKADGTRVQTNQHGFVITPAPKKAEAEQVVADASADAMPDQTSLTDDDTDEFSLPDSLELSDEVKEALNIDVDSQAVEIIRKAKNLDASTMFIFINTFKRYLTLVHIARRLERKMNHANVELTIIGSTGAQVANPLIVQYKQVSQESNATIKVLLSMVAKMNASDGDDDPLAKALRGGE
jgi:hypothetical protein